VQQTTHDRMQFADLSGREVIVLSNIHALTPAEVSRVADAVTSGRSLVLFPGKETDYEQLNKGLLSTLGIPAMTAADLRQLAPDRTGFVTFADVDYRHPVFEGMFMQEPGKRGSSPAVESPHIRAAAGLRPGTSGMPIISMSDGRPFLCEYTAGKGRVLVFAVESGTTWSDFPFKGLFAPLMHRSMLYLASQHDPAEVTTVGDRLRFSVRMTAEESGRGYLVKTPSGGEERVRAEQHTASGITVFQTTPSQEVGIYELLSAGGASGRTSPMQALAVNSAAPESDLSRATQATLEAFWNRMGISTDQIRHIDAPQDIPRAIEESRFGVELWRYLVALALACALIEMSLSRASTSLAGKEEHAEHNQ